MDCDENQHMFIYNIQEYYMFNIEEEEIKLYIINT